MRLHTFFISTLLLVCVESNAQQSLPVRINDVPKNEPLAGGVYMTPGLCGILHTWGFVGDSLSSGELESVEKDGKSGYNDIYEYSWGQRMCAYMGTSGDNYSKGGETAQGWIKNFWDNPKNKNNNIDAKADPKQAYIIALLVNDAIKGIPAGNPDTDVNLNDYTKNAETFAGSYAGIIQRLKSIQPDAKFFVVTAPKGKNFPTYNSVVRSMADLFENVYVLDLEKYSPDYTDESFKKVNFTGGHMNAIGYEFTAWMFMNYIDWIIRTNIEDFLETGFIGRNLNYSGTRMLYRGLPAKASSEVDYDAFVQQYKLNKAEWDAAFTFLKSKDLSTLAPGKYELTAKGTYAEVQELKKTKGSAKKIASDLDLDRKNVEIHYVVNGEELMSDASRQVLINDTTFFITFPNDHFSSELAPSGKKCTKVKKVVIRVPYSGL